MQRHDLIDTDGENKAIRSFLRFYLKPGISIGEMRDNMEMAGWEGCWPESIGAADWYSTLTKLETQAWLRHLFSLEAAMSGSPAIPSAVPVYVACPECGAAHVDEGEWATRLHKTHQCQACHHEWRPYNYPTVGIAQPTSGSLAGHIAEDRHLLDWLGKNFHAGALDEFDQMTIKHSVKWEFLAPKGVNTDIRAVLHAAYARDETHTSNRGKSNEY